MESGEVIKSISYNQHEILYNIIQLHNNGQPFDCDPTYSKGKFYGKAKLNKKNGEQVDVEIPQPIFKFDVNPQVDGVVQIEPLGHLPLGDGSIHSICIDLPFLLGCGPSVKKMKDGDGVKNNFMLRRFAYYYPLSSLLESYKHWITEAYRVLDDGGICVFKCQNVITASKFLGSPYYSKLIADSVGFDMLDEFVLLAKGRLVSGKIKKQQHARSYHSYFLVFKKSLKKKIPYFDFMDNETIRSLMQGLVDNNVKKKK